MTLFSKKHHPIVTGLLLLAIGIIVIIQFFKDFKFSFKTPVSVADMTTAELVEGALVEDDIFAVLDCFMYEESITSKYGIETSSSISNYYYIIPVLTKDNEELYMAIELPSATENKINSICKDTINYLYGEMSEEKFGYNTYHITGPIRNMNDEEIHFMIEWFQKTEYFGTRNAADIRSYIYPVMIEKYNPDAARLGVTIGALIVFVGLISFIGGLIFRKSNVSTSNNPTYTPRKSYTTYQTGFIQTAASEDPLSEEQQAGFLNQQNKGYLNQQDNSHLLQKNNQAVNQTVNAAPNPQTNAASQPSTELHNTTEQPAVQNSTPSHPSHEKPKKSSGLSDIFFKVDHK